MAEADESGLYHNAPLLNTTIKRLQFMRNKKEMCLFSFAAAYSLASSFSVFLELDNPEARVAEIHSIVHRLPEKNRQMLELLMKHLAK